MRKALIYSMDPEPDGYMWARFPLSTNSLPTLTPGVFSKNKFTDPSQSKFISPGEFELAEARLDLERARKSVRRGKKYS